MNELTGVSVVEQNNLPCALHAKHDPPALNTKDFHHIIVVGWQQVWQPPQPWPFPGPDSRGSLWDSRGIVVPQTCHRNVHYWIVQMMRRMSQLVALGVGESDALAQVQIEMRPKYRDRKRQDQAAFDCAVLTPQRWLTAGGSLAKLFSLSEWGQV